MVIACVANPVAAPWTGLAASPQWTVPTAEKEQVSVYQAFLNAVGVQPTAASQLSLAKLCASQPVESVKQLGLYHSDECCETSEFCGLPLEFCCETVYF